MKAFIDKKRTFIKLTPVPEKTIINGLQVFHLVESDDELPKVCADIIAGEKFYDLTVLPQKIRDSIYRVELVEGDNNTLIYENTHCV